MPRFQVHVVPRSSRAGPDGRYDGLPRLRVRSPATDGRANAEAERALTGLLKERVRLVGGARSRRKTFNAELAPADVEQRLREAFGD